MNPTTWICDKCGDRIESVDDAWLQWIKVSVSTADPFADEDGDEEQFCQGLQLVHTFDACQRAGRPRCTYVGRAINGTVSDTALNNYRGADSLMLLLGFLAEKKFKDQTEVLEMIKRLWVPGYEETKDHLHEAASEGVFDLNQPEKYPDQEQIQAVLKWLQAAGVR